MSFDTTCVSIPGIRAQRTILGMTFRPTLHLRIVISSDCSTGDFNSETVFRLIEMDRWFLYASLVVMVSLIKWNIENGHVFKELSVLI